MEIWQQNQQTHTHTQNIKHHQWFKRVFSVRYFLFYFFFNLILEEFCMYGTRHIELTFRLFCNLMLCVGSYWHKKTYRWKEKEKESTWYTLRVHIFCAYVRLSVWLSVIQWIANIESTRMASQANTWFTRWLYNFFFLVLCRFHMNRVIPHKWKYSLWYCACMHCLRAKFFMTLANFR